MLRLTLLSLMASAVAAGRSHACYAPGTILPVDFVFADSPPGKWGPPQRGTGAVVTYSFATADYAANDLGTNEDEAGFITPLSACMPAGAKAEIVRAFAAWSAVANIQFVEVEDSGDALEDPDTTGDLRIGCHRMDGPFGTLAHAYFPPVNSGSAAGDIHFDESEEWKIGFDDTDGIDIFQVAAHEIGHAIGLAHQPVVDSVALMNPIYTEAFVGPQADDIAGAQAIYGVIPATDAAVQQLITLVNGLVDEVAAVKAQLNDEARFTSDAELATNLDAVKAALAQSQNAAHADSETLRSEIGQVREMVEWIAKALYSKHHHSSSSSS